MTRALISQPSPLFLTNDIFSENPQPDPSSALHTPFYQTPSQCTRSKDIIIIPNKPRSRPTYIKMIEEAVFENSVKRKGASLIAIKKYLQNKYGLDVKKPVIAKRICKCIRESAIEGGHLKQTTGTGAQGSFILQKDIRNKMQVKKERKERSLSKSANNTPSIKKKKINAVPKKASENKKQKSSKAKANTVHKKGMTEMKKHKSKADTRLSNTPVTRMRVN